MKVALTGATGFIGSRVLGELLRHGHQATALVRSEAAAAAVAARGATPAIVDLLDRAAVAALLAEASPTARARLGDQLAEVMLLDQVTAAARARVELDWAPPRPGLVEEFGNGSYRQGEAVR